MDIEMQVDSNRLVLRRFQPTDTTRYTEIMTDPQVTRFLGSGKIRTPDDIRRSLEKINETWDRCQFGVWAVVLKNTDRVIGHCGFLPLDGGEEIELLYALAKDEWGKGYATEAAASAIRFAQSTYAWECIVALAYPENRASIHVIEKLGFYSTGVLSAFGHKLNHYTLNLGKTLA